MIELTPAEEALLRDVLPLVAQDLVARGLGPAGGDLNPRSSEGLARRVSLDRASDVRRLLARLGPG